MISSFAPRARARPATPVLPPPAVPACPEPASTPDRAVALGDDPMRLTYFMFLIPGAMLFTLAVFAALLTFG